MYCNNSCIIGISLFSASIFVMTSSLKKKKNKLFLELLNDNQKNIYKHIKNERLNIYICASIASIIITYLITKNIKTPINKYCSRLLISSFVTYLYYNLYPKSQYILPNLNTKEQVKAWLDIYKHMKYRYHLGMFFGIISYMFVYSVLEK